MPPEAPTFRELKQLAARWGFSFGPDALRECAELGYGLLSSFEALEGGDLQERSSVRAQTGWFPTTAENPLGGWSWRCEIDDGSEGSLSGKRVAVKDNVAVAGVPLHNGSEVFEGYTPDEDATAVSRILSAGGLLAGKAVNSAFCLDAFGLTCYPTNPVNPRNTLHAAGGSSTGCGVLVSAGDVELALGSDQAGSVRIPASWCGCCGLKPTYGLVPYTGAIGLEHRIDHLGPMASTVADCGRLLSVLAGRDGADPRQLTLPDDSEVSRKAADLTLDSAAGLRIGVLHEGFGLPDVSEPEVDAAVRRTAEALARAGADVRDVSCPGHTTGLTAALPVVLEGMTETVLGHDRAGASWQHQEARGFLEFYGRARQTRADSYPAGAKLIALLGSYLSEQYHHQWYASGIYAGNRLRYEYDELFQNVDLLLLPTTPMRAQRKTILTTVTDYINTAVVNTKNTIPFNLTGHPALSVPCSWVDNMPVGAMLVGRHFDDHTVLAVGQMIEKAREKHTP